MLTDGMYKMLKKDPTAKIKKVDTALKQAEKEGELPREKRLALMPHSFALPQLHGLPKIHKESTPPPKSIMSTNDSPTYSLANI